MLALYGVVLEVDGVVLAGRERVGERTGRREGGALRQRQGDALARVGSEELRELHQSASPSCSRPRWAVGSDPPTIAYLIGLSGVTYLVQGGGRLLANAHVRHRAGCAAPENVVGSC